MNSIKYSTRELIKQVREKINDDFQENPSLYDKEDIKKVFEKNYYIERCLIWENNSVDKATEMVKKCFQWRKSSKLIYTKPSDFPSEFYSIGGLFNLGKDKEGSPVFYMRTRFLKRFAPMDEVFKRYLAYELNKLDEKCQTISSWAIIFDCSGVGIQNVQFDLFCHLVNIMTNYFTLSVKYIVALEVPWFLGKVQKIFYAVLPEVAKKVILFENRITLTRLIDHSNLPDYLGGNVNTADHHKPPIGCKSIEEIGSTFNLTEKQIESFKKLYEVVD